MLFALGNLSAFLPFGPDGFLAAGAAAKATAAGAADASAAATALARISALAPSMGPLGGWTAAAAAAGATGATGAAGAGAAAGLDTLHGWGGSGWLGHRWCDEALRWLLAPATEAAFGPSGVHKLKVRSPEPPPLPVSVL